MILLEHLHMEQWTHPFQLLNHVIVYQIKPNFIGPNAPIMHILAIFHLKFGVWCVCGVFIIKGFTLKSEGANMYYVANGHCSVFKKKNCNKNNYHP